LIISFLVGNRTLEDCRKFFKDLSGRLNNKPLFVSDELPHYETVILETYHTTQIFEKTGKPGRPKNPVIKIDEQIDYAVVHKTREKGTVKKVETRVVFGNERFIKPHASISKNPDKTYTPRTPALKAGIIEANWTTKFAFERTELNITINLRHYRTLVHP